MLQIVQKDAQKDAHAQNDAHANDAHAHDAEEITPEKRRQQILRILEETPKISVFELSKIFSVSRTTISRDLRKLQRVAQDNAQDDTQK